MAYAKQRILILSNKENAYYWFSTFKNGDFDPCNQLCNRRSQSSDSKIIKDAMESNPFIFIRGLS